MRLIVLAFAAALFAGLLPPAHASDGPALTVDEATLDAALHCPDTFTSGWEPVLLVHGTFTNDQENWGWSYLEALPVLGFDVCTVTLPNRSLNDIQVSTEYVVHAIRKMAAATGKQVDVAGHSQGGLQPRWAVRWWPDVQASVDDLVMLATPNHGTGPEGDSPFGCFESCHQMRPGSAFLGALNAPDETPGDVSYTSVFSQFDVLVPPSTAPLMGATNVLVQDLCPGRPLDHAGFAADAVAFNVVLDAFRNVGSFDADRFDPATCLTIVADGTSPVRMLEIGLAELQDGEFPDLFGSYSADEPPLRDYAR